MGLGEISLGEMGLGEMGLGEMGQNRFVLVSWLLYLFTTVLYDDMITS